MSLERLQDLGAAELRAPASRVDLDACEARLGHPLPSHLREVLVESDGVTGEHGLTLVWPALRIGEDNIFFRTFPEYVGLYMPFDSLVFFGDDGGGDQFGVSLAGNQEVYRWDHEDDSRTWVAATVLVFLDWWLTGRIEP